MFVIYTCTYIHVHVQLYNETSNLEEKINLSYEKSRGESNSSIQLQYFRSYP